MVRIDTIARALRPRQGQVDTTRWGLILLPL